MAIRTLLLTLAIVLHVSPTFAQDARAIHEAGVEANRRGDHATALELFRSLAHQGYAEGQDSLGPVHTIWI